MFLLCKVIDLFTVAQVSQSHDLLARILQLSSTLPAALQSPGDKLAPVLFDFRFFRDPDAHERRIEGDQELTELDEDFREVHSQATLSSCTITEIAGINVHFRGPFGTQMV